MDDRQTDELQAALARSLSRHWVWFLVKGLALLLLGVLAMLLPSLASLVATVFLGWLLLLAGLIGLFTTLRARQAPGFGWSLLSALLGLGAGALLLLLPLHGIFTLTAVLIAFLIGEGVISAFYALEHRRNGSRHWRWMLGSGLLNIVLGAVLLAGLPGSALWALGLLLGIELVFAGCSLIMMALGARQHAPGAGAAAGPI